MIDPLFANLFFITATAVMFMAVFVATVLLVHVMKLIHAFHDILESLKRTTEKVETVSGNFLTSVEHQAENVSGLFNSILGFFGSKNKAKKAKAKTVPKKVSARKFKNND